MGEAYFYHLTRDGVDRTLSTLLGRARQQGWRVAVRGSDPDRLRWLDEKLWLGPADGFLAHGLAGGAHDARQPILLTTEDPAIAPANAPNCLMTVDGADIAPREVTAMMRSCILFDGLDGDAVARARQQWKMLTDAGCGARYWSEEGGKWEEKARKNV